MEGIAYINLVNEEIYCKFQKGIIANKSTVFKYFKDFDLTVQMQYESGIFKNVININRGRIIENSDYKTL